MWTVSVVLWFTVGELDNMRKQAGPSVQIFSAHLPWKAPGLGPDPVPQEPPGCPMFVLWIRHRTVSLGNCSHFCHHPPTLCGFFHLGSSTLLALPIPRRCHQPRIQTPKPTRMGPRRSLWLQHSHLHPPPRPPHPPPQTQMCPSRNLLEAESQVRPEPALLQPWEAMERRSPLLSHS